MFYLTLPLQLKNAGSCATLEQQLRSDADLADPEAFSQVLERTLTCINCYLAPPSNYYNCLDQQIALQDE